MSATVIALAWRSGSPRAAEFRLLGDAIVAARGVLAVDSGADNAMVPSIS